jgi:hypothetical protein
MNDKKEITKGLRVKKSKEIKLKDKAGRNFILMHLKDFGFTPNDLIIEKVYGETNKFIIMAVLTDEQIKKENEAYKKYEEKKKGDDKHGREQSKQSDLHPVTG